MADLVKNSYFYPEIKKEEVPQVQEAPQEPKQEFRQYEEGEGQEVPESAPKAEPEKGLTSIIIPAYLNTYPVFHMTGNCIGSIREHTDKIKTPYEIILILNGNGIKFDNLESTKADKVIVNEENKGYAVAVNQGIRVARGEYIAIINNDVQVYGYWLEDMQECLSNPDFALDLVMATPMYGKPYARGVEANELRLKAINSSSNLSDFRDFSCVLTRKDLFSEIGLLNEEFFVYGEDLDLLRRMDKAGKKYASTKMVNTHHIIGATSSGMEKTPEIMNESKAKLKEIWGE